MRLIDADELDSVIAKLNTGAWHDYKITRNEYKLISSVLFEFPTIKSQEPKTEPCEDAVSRQAVLDVVSNPLNIMLEEIIKKLPSVTPQEPKTDVLDKIRAEIEDRMEAEIGDYRCERNRARRECLDIIDKYRWRRMDV